MGERMLLVFANTSNWYDPLAEKNYQLVSKFQICVYLTALNYTNFEIMKSIPVL
jgi:hypothetical protein